jgi:hypothetical protein
MVPSPRRPWMASGEACGRAPTIVSHNGNSEPSRRERAVDERLFQTVARVEEVALVEGDAMLSEGAFGLHMAASDRRHGRERKPTVISTMQVTLHRGAGRDAIDSHRFHGSFPTPSTLGRSGGSPEIRKQDLRRLGSTVST